MHPLILIYTQMAGDLVKERLSKRTILFLRSYFFKLSIIYAIIAAVLLWLLAAVITYSYTEVLYNKELQFEQLIVNNVHQYLNNQEKNSKSIIKTMYMMDDNMPATLRRVLSDSTDLTQYREDYEAVSAYMNSFLLDNKSIVNIILFDKDGAYINFTNNFNIKYESVDFNNVLVDHNISDKKSFQLIPTYASPYSKADYDYLYSYHTTLFDLDAPNEIKGSIIINHYVSDIYDIYEEYIENLLGTIIVLNQQGYTIYDSSGMNYMKTHPLSEPILQEDTKTLEAHGFRLVSGSVPKSDFVVVSVIPEDKLSSKYQNITNAITVILFTMITVLSIVTFILFGIFKKKIDRIRLAMKKMQTGELGVMIPLTKSKDEVDQISKGFNTMSQQLEDYINKVYVSELKTKKAELVTLQYQINPHFLYNTLESFRMTALKSNNTLLADMILNLSQMLRKSSKTTSIIWSFQDEMDYSIAYLELYKIRYPDRLISRINIEPKLRGKGTLKFIIQPIIENTVKYCLVPTDATLKVEIDARIEDDYIIVTIRDNGIGINPEKLNAITASLGDHTELPAANIGLKNINERIRLLFGDDYGMSIESHIDMGTCVSLKLPLTIPDDNNKKDINVDGLMDHKGDNPNHV